MGRVNGEETKEQIPPKIIAMYEAVGTLIERGINVSEIRVAMITEEAGIGKGTAYEYFDSKEEILLGALQYEMCQVIQEARVILKSEPHFASQIEGILKLLEKQERRKEYMINFMHMLTDNSQLGQMVRQRMAEPDEKPFIFDLLKEMLEMGMERGELRNDLPIQYMVLTLFSRLMSYMMYHCHSMKETISREEMRELVCQGILDELCEKKQ